MQNGLTLCVTLVAFHAPVRRYQQLVLLGDQCVLSTNSDLLAIVPNNLPEPFDTAMLATSMSIPRGLAQQIAYCCRHTGAIEQVGKRGNNRLYRRAA